MPREQIANAVVIGRLDVQQESSDHVVELLAARARVEDLGISRVADEGLVGEHGKRIGERRDQPGGSAVKCLASMDGLELAQPVEIRVELAATTRIQDDLDDLGRVGE